MQRHMPIGYKMIDGKIEIETDKANIVKKIFTDYLNGNSLLSIAKTLMEKDVLTANNKVNWTHCSVGKILENAKYIGDEYYPQIIDKNTFEAVQERRKKISNQLGRTSQLNSMKNKTVFSGRIYCGKCGKPYRKYRGIVWKCKNYDHCKNQYFTENEFKTMFISAVNELLKNKLLFKKAPPKEPPTSSYKLRQIENQIKQLQEKESSSTELAKLIFKHAEIVYIGSKIYDYEIKTEKIKKALDGSEITSFDDNLFETIVQKIIVFKDGTVKFKFINGIIIERNGPNGSCKKDSSNYTSANSI